MTMQKEEKLLSYLVKNDINLDNLSRYECFKLGFEYAEQLQTKEKQRKEKRKRKELIIEDFIDTSLKNNALQQYSQLIKHEENNSIVTNGYYLCIHKDNYSKELEGKLTDKNGNVTELNRTYPNYKRVIPLENLVDITDKVSLEDFKIISKLNKKEEEKVKIKEIDEIMSIKTIYFVVKFLKTKTNYKIYQKDSVVKIVSSDGDVFVFRLLNRDIVDYNYIFSTATKEYKENK